MEEWDAMKMLDMYIHDYLIRKNMHAAAEIFAIEANVCPKNVAVTPPQGFLPEWWSLFWDIYFSRLPNDLDIPESSGSKAIQMADNVLQNNQPYMPCPDLNYLLQNVCPAIPNPGLPNLPQTVCPMMPRPRTGNVLPSVVIPGPETNLNRFGAGTAMNMSQGIAVAMHEQAHPRLPTKDMSSNSLARGALAFPCAPPSSCDSRLSQKKKAKDKRQLSVTRDDKSTAAESTPLAPKAMQIKTELADTGSSTSSNSTRSDRGS